MAEKSSNVWFDTSPILLLLNEIQLPKRQTIFSALFRPNRPSPQPVQTQSTIHQKTQNSRPQKIFKLFLVTNGLSPAVGRCCRAALKLG
jgi:hypothetical protein